MKDPTADLKGTFWLPASPEKRVAGTLTWRPKGNARLDLIGTLSAGRRLDPDSLHVHGEVQGVEITLADCREVSRQGFFDQSPTSQYLVGAAYKNVHFASPADTTLNRYSCGLEQMRNWIRDSGIKWGRQSDDDETDSPHSETLILTPLPTLRVSRSPVEVSITHHVDAPYTAYAPLTLTDEFRLRVTSEEPLPIEQVEEVVTDLVHLVSLGLDRPVGRYDEEGANDAYQSKTWDGDGAVKLSRRITILPSFKTDAEDAEPGFIVPERLNFTFNDINQMEGVGAWLDLMARHRLAAYRVGSHRMRHTRVPQDDFINLVAAAEGIHRNSSPAKTSDTKKWTLAGRIHGLVDRCGDRVTGRIDSIDKWVGLVVRERNDIAHHLAKRNARDWQVLVPLAETVYYLCVMALLEQMGQRDAMDQTSKNSRFRHYAAEVNAYVAGS